ncbi:MAG: peptide-methionine (R)-S-oxide reductase MsrB [Chthoniobacterales bacterium]
MDGGRISSEEKSTISTYVGIIAIVALVAGVIYFFLFTQQKTQAVTGFDPNRPIPSDAELKRRLKPEQYHIVREGGTQVPMQNEFWNKDNVGLYVDVITGEPLFTSVDKYDAGLGMPTWSKPISKDLLVEKLDTSFGMQRTEVSVKRSNAHLGHVFTDPQSPTGVRYTLNSAAFKFIPIERMQDDGYGAYLPLLEKK